MPWEGTPAISLSIGTAQGDSAGNRRKHDERPVGVPCEPKGLWSHKVYLRSTLDVGIIPLLGRVML